MKIEAITQGKQPQVVFVCLDDGTRMRMHATVVADQGLYPGMELTAQQLETIEDAAARASARMRAVRIISAASATEAALERKLIQKGERPEDARDAVAWLKDLNLLDDAQAARQIVQSGVRKGYGPARIKQMLYEKQVPRPYWEEALAQIPDQSAAIDAFVQKRLGGRVPDRAEIQRLTGALVRRGHSWNEIRSALNRYTQACGEQLEDDDTYGI